MKVLLLGLGMQGKAALHDLVNSEAVDSIVVADCNSDGELFLKQKNYDKSIEFKTLDASNSDQMDALFSGDVDVAIDLLPPAFVADAARCAVKNGVDIVNTFYVTPEVKELECRARDAGVSILPEFGMDPGIDLVLLKQAVSSLEKVESVVSYGAGFPEPTAADNPLKYKVTWTFEGVLSSYKRAGRVIRNGEIVDVNDTEMFSEANIHTLELPELGTLEAFPNGDVMKYVDVLGLNVDELQDMGRYVLRWPGHCAFWRTISGLHLLDDEPVCVDGVDVLPKKFLNAAIGHQLKYKEHERDVVVVYVEAKGLDAAGKRKKVTCSLVDYRDLESGITAMSRTVGFTASIGAQLLGSGRLDNPGLLSPLNDIPFELFKEEMAKRNLIAEYRVCDSVKCECSE